MSQSRAAAPASAGVDWRAIGCVGEPSPANSRLGEPSGGIAQVSRDLEREQPVVNRTTVAPAASRRGKDRLGIRITCAIPF